MQNNPNKEIIKEGKNTAITAYFTFVGTLIAWSMNSENRNPYASFHIRQALGLNILFILIGVLISGVSGIAAQKGFDIFLIIIPFWLVFILLWAFGFTGALQGKWALIPIIGSVFQKWFKKIA